jgi:hypothetical protein
LGFSGSSISPKSWATPPRPTPAQPAAAAAAASAGPDRSSFSRRETEVETGRIPVRMA